MVHQGGIFNCIDTEERQMTAYVIMDINVTDPVGYEEYKRLAPAAAALHGGRYIARGGTTETLEGDWSPDRLIVIQFDSVDRAKTWLNSAEYSLPRQLRHKTSTCNMVVIEGV